MLSVLLVGLVLFDLGTTSLPAHGQHPDDTLESPVRAIIEGAWWNNQVELGSTVTLNCSEGKLPLRQSWQNSSWALPDLTIITPGEVRIFPNDDKSKASLVSVSKDGEILTIENLQDHLCGLYYCVIVDKEHAIHLSKRGINMQQYIRDEVYGHYMKSILISAIACGIFSTIMLISVIAFCCARRSSKKKAEGSQASVIGGNNMYLHSPPPYTTTGKPVDKVYF